LKDAMSRDILQGFEAAGLQIASATYELVGLLKLRIEEHRAVSTLPDGKPMDILACVVGRVGPSGKLVELHEYLDTAQRTT